MIEYWSVIGRMVVDKGFRGEVFGCLNSKNHQELVALHRFLCGPASEKGCALRLSRWELCDASRTAAFFEREVERDGDVGQLIETLRSAWETARLDPLDLEAAAWLGLLLIDLALCGRYVMVKSVPELDSAAAAAPVFHFKKKEELVRFLRVSGVTTSLTELSGKSWIPPGKLKTLAAAGVLTLSAFILHFKSGRTKVQCSAGQTPLQEGGDPLPYVHVLPAFVDKLAARLVPLQRRLRI